MTRKLIKGIVSAAMASIAAAATIFSVSAYDLERHTQAEIKEMYNKLFFDIHTMPVYKEDYSLEYPGRGGMPDADTLEEGLNSINFCRYLAGLPFDVELDDTYNTAAQNASLIIYMNSDKPLSHKPVQPDNMSDELYAAALKASGECNIGKGYLNIQTSVVQGYMSDTDSVNLPSMGHRRWILNPEMKKTGLGIVGYGTAMYVRDRTRAEKFTGDYLCWPPSLMPNEMVGDDPNGYAYSVTLNNGYDTPDRNKVKVKLTSKLTGKTWTFDKNSSNDVSDMVGYFNINEQYMGFGKCIIFNPGPLPDNDVVDVQITGIYKNGIETPINYKVVYFDLLDDSEYKLGFEKDRYELELGQSLLLNGYNDPLSNGGYRLLYAAEGGSYKDLVDRIESGPTVLMTAKQEGTLYCYLGTSLTDYFEDKCAVISITHKHERGGWIIETVPTAMTEGLRYRKCSICGKEIDREIMPATSVEAADVTFTEDKYIYTGYAVTPKIKVYSGEKRLTEGTDYKVLSEDNTELGTGYVIIDGMGYFSGEKKVPFEIVRRDPVALSELEISFRKDGLYYTGKNIEPKLTINEGSYTLIKDRDYTLTYENNRDAGTGSAVVKGMGDYVGIITLNFDILPADIGYPWAEPKLGEVKYTGMPIMLKLKLLSQVTGEELIEGVDYKTSYDSNTAIGTASVTVTGMGNYCGTSTNTFTIVAPENYSGDDRTDVVELGCNTAVSVKGAGEDDTDISFVSTDGVVYKAVAVISGTFYTDLPDGDYEIWVVRKSCQPAHAGITVGSTAVSVDIKAYQYGDINRDGSINVADVVLSAAFVKGLRVPADDSQRDIADVNRDGRLNVTDISKIAAHNKGIRRLYVDVKFEIPNVRDNTAELLAAAYDKAKEDYLAEFDTEWGEKSEGKAGFSQLDIDGDGIGELFIMGSYIYGTPDRLYTYDDGKAVLLKEADTAGGRHIVISNEKCIYVQWTEGGSTYFEVYSFDEKALTLKEKLVFSPKASDDADLGDFTRIDAERLTKLNENTIVFD
ncbi:dockerin type I domain-containing protein [uncultured Ruminococcus sp.]|uniref:dockerin type I domain-containing protein n=1 Tax=uncultured Ruminococcus sp. TaxID=165186 RepID=UPI0025EB91D6|nr:dockerin type I domain-containing protein [uncultured Ruminococcus sp.]